jgi:hypothetical protein
LAPTWRLVYRNVMSSYHLLGLVGNASYWDNGAPRLEPMDFVKETAHFYFYRPHAADSPTIEFAFAKYAEIPASDGLLQSAAWRRDRSGWHWEWTHRDSPATEMPAPPTLLIPGPVSKSQSAANVPAVVVATQR